MIALIAAVALIAAPAQPARADGGAARTGTAKATPKGDRPGTFDAARVTAVLDNAHVGAGGMAGTVLIARGGHIVYERAFGTVDPAGGAVHRLGAVWRWASVTKQITATIAMQEVAAGRLDLDAPIRRYLPASRAPFADRITTRMLMQHVSGLPDTNDSPKGADGWMRFYTVKPPSPETGVAWCEGPTDRAPPAAFRYGDCDFIETAAVIEAVTGKSYSALVRERITKLLGLKSVGLFPRDRPTVAGFEGGKPESTSFRIGNFGAAGALYGTTHDLLSFDRALMDGRLIPAAQRAEMWRGDPKLGFAALGQWSFASPLKGCPGGAIRFVERRGAIGGVVLRNVILPELDTVLIMTANRDEADAAFGEIWQQKGITHDVLAAALCA